jgi:NAD(P)-dependent dehydrogenase (short-subunit alcohol dehydrogenase family)
VIVVDRLEENIGHAINQLAETELEANYIIADVMQEKSLKNSMEKIIRDFGHLDILVNCAFSGPVPELDQATFEEYDTGFHNGPSAYGVAAQQAAKYMKKSGGGSIINLASMYGLVTGYPEVYQDLTSPNSIVYQAGKAAIIHMTRYMAVYWAKHSIRVNCISPGAFPNESVQNLMPEFIERLEKKIPMARIGKPSELKGAVVFLASAASTYITGQNLIVDGGWTLW